MERLEQLDKAEALRYLGYHDVTPDERTMKLVDNASIKLLAHYEPRYIFGVYDIINNTPIQLSNCTLKLCGEDIKIHLNGCTRVVLTSVTISAEVDKLIRTTQIEDMTTGIIIDCCATALIEQVCNQVEEEIKADLAKNSDFPLYFTNRYSPGYGDLPLDIQGEFLKVIDAPKRIGLCASETNILTPRKSVTAIIGVATQPIKPNKRSCKNCNLQEKCKFRKRGDYCEL